MKIVTVNLPVSYINAIEALTGENGLYPSRSELIRVAVREFLIRELESAKSFRKYHESKQQKQKSIYPTEELRADAAEEYVTVGDKTYRIVRK